MIRTCKCGVDFQVNHKRQIYCNIKCANKFNPSRIDVDRNRDWKYKQKYGISLEDYNKMFQEQNGCCAICKTHQAELKNKLSIDHCHKTERIRGLLCQKCNHAIGLLNDDPDLIESAKEYVSLQAEF